MYYYEVIVASNRYHGKGPLTYSFATMTAIGMVVEVPLGAVTSLGIVVNTVNKPAFAAKSIIREVVNTPVPKQILDLHAWLLEYYPGPSGLTTQLFLPSSIGTPSRTKKTAPASHNEPTTLPSLSHEQHAAITAIQEGSGSFLLHGETGSGKTRVYIELALHAMKNQASSIILTPEIGLTTQLSSSFEAVFPGKVITIHSTQTPAERRDKWNRINASNHPLIIIGPRSALFAPVHAIGLIVLDECHDAAYKQDQTPYYQTTRVAARLAALHQARLVLGSATPSVHDYYAFQAKKLPIIRMEQAAKGDTTSVVTAVNLTDRSQFSKSPWLSNQLIDEIQSAMQAGYQSLIFLNRRGTARIVLCQHCGWQATCQRCDLPLTYHGDIHRLQCHTCGFSDRAPVACPSCAKPEVQFKSIGTKTIITELERLFPDAKLMRFDSDNKKSENLESQFDLVHAGGVDIIVGTQMLSKGLDLPLLQVIGVVVADTSLYFPDFTAEERTFQMLRQVIGRVGRGHIPGKVVIQSYHPKSIAIQSAIAKDYGAFFEAQLSERKLYGFPPFYFVLKITVSRAAESAASKAAHDLAKTVLTVSPKLVLSGPAPAFSEKTHGKFHWQIIVKSTSRAALISVIEKLPKNCSYDLDPNNLL